MVSLAPNFNPKSYKMKKQFLALVFGAFAMTAFSQTTVTTNGGVSTGKGTYLGISTGINSPSGAIGLRLDSKLSDKVMLGVGAGLGSWGYKISFTGYYQTPSNWCPMFGIGRASGAPEVPITIQESGKLDRTININLDPVTYANLGVQKQWFTNKGNRLFIELGYCFAFNNNAFKPVNPAEKLSVETRQVINFISPGGLIAAFGFALKL